MKKYNRGGANTLLLVILIVLVCTIGGYLIWNNMSNTNNIISQNQDLNIETNTNDASIDFSINNSKNEAEEEKNISDTLLFNKEEVNRFLKENAKLLQTLIVAKTSQNDFKSGEYTDEEMLEPVQVFIVQTGGILESEESDGMPKIKVDIDIFQKYAKRLFGKEVDFSKEMDGAIVENGKVKLYSITGFGIEFYNAKNIIKNFDDTYTLSFDVIGYTSDESGITLKEDDILSSYDLVFIYKDNGGTLEVKSLTRTFAKE